MSIAQAAPEYVLGGTESEYQRLARQANTLAPCTERLFRDAGVGLGQRVLDVGSGVGDVALLAAALVGSAGSVLGIDRDATALAKARARAAAARADNVELLGTELSDLRIEGRFDAIIGRFVLMFLPDPVATLRSLASHLRPGGVIVFQEPSWASFYALAGHLPLRSACADLVCNAFRRAGARPDMPLTLYRGLIDCGFPAPQLRIDVPTAQDTEGHRWMYDLMVTLRPRFQEFGLATDAIGPFDTLAARLESEVEAARSFVPFVGLVGAWARRPI
jgi:ubiquinone/menaquinone biosynthesis C-methylase UbiE